MDLKSLLINSKSAIIKRWFNVLADSYPQDTSKFLRNKKDAFDNPVGSSIRDGISGILDCMFEAVLNEGGPVGFNREAIIPFIDRIVRIRAVQNFRPSESLSFIPELKGIFRDVMGKYAEDAGLDFDRLDQFVDDLLFLSFDVFLDCRERIYEIRANDEKRRYHMLLRRAKLIVEDAGEPEVELPDFRNGGFETNE